ncbi:ABC transporter permease [Gemella sp. zg-1178]|uniref:ABC transporter permease n=1 Tax=Gemella sp. zg-1178 TaxID=2840372 RepID=UPI001C054635|nr:ABC transporter permease subunit [Gemella sp. zg-1178]MBU0278177.1 ABC transporter permease subunit [Gemella sp. zg-1178]
MKLFINEFAKDYKKISTYLYFLISFAILFIVNFANTRGDISQVQGYHLIVELLNVVTSISYIFILIMFANNLSQEYSRGTIKFLYSKPKSRSSILTTKIFLAIFNYFLFTLILVAFDFILKYFVFYKGKINLHTVFTEKLGEENFNRIVWQHLGIIFLASLVTVLFYISLVLLICVLFKTQILSLVVVLVMVLAGGAISGLSTLIIPKFEYIKYIFTNIQSLPSYYISFNGRTIIEEAFKLNGRSLLLMALAYTVFFTLVSYIVNARRDITLS